MTSDAEWTWKFTERATEQFGDLDTHVQDRVVSKLDEVVDSTWHEPKDFLEPLTGGPFWKLRVGTYRLACVLAHDASVLEIHRIEHRNGAYTADDD